MPKQQRARTPKTSKGIHGGGGKYRPTAVEKILFGGGALRTINNSSSKRAKKIIAEQQKVGAS